MRAFSWLLSLLLHTALVVVLVQTMHLAQPDLRELMELDLTRIAQAEPEALFAPLPVPLPPPPVPEPDVVEPEVVEPEIPESEMTNAPLPPALPMDKTILLDDAPPPEPLAAPEPAAEVVPESGAVEISPVKEGPPLEESPREESLAKPADPAQVREDKAPPIEVSRHDIIAHRGHEARFGRSMMADHYSYEATEFSGQFRTRDDRVISIIDARDTKYGRFLIYDSKNKTLRRLKEFGKYVYTIGPSLDADEPVAGTVTFLAKDDRIERFILMTDDDRLAHFPVKVHVRESDVRFPVPGEEKGSREESTEERAGRTTLPPTGTGHPGVVLAYGGKCVDEGLIQGFTRSLSVSGLAVFSFVPSGCNDPEGLPVSQPVVQPLARQVAETVAAVNHFAGLDQIDRARVGIWGNGPGANAALRAALQAISRKKTEAGSDAVRPAYVVCLLDDTVGPDGLPGRQELAALDMPVLWLITGRSLGRWQSFVAMLEGLRDHGLHGTDRRAFTIVMAPLKASREVQAAQSELSGWVEQVTEEHARLGASWITGLPRQP
ncbi:MAG: hypothetical protein KUA35_15175 [Pseudodesulfovibrio sp.]|uniref:Uncharacterized protein n=1 Tax=Pseudodesulfovibrio aespoeensis (strain ATCC 700646 / DSM 10631 / Aspo-2) TaxID=643562 RepID=E6VRQ7_PSEA9|nr:MULTISPECIES: hypothetical protein [Pseudodesulfovibrio]MBU4191085.1 hypothetical protein [Pseudomonadota bacterium]ADU64194.1 hypothetical protein Daes_3202 [Pseudodesulfovibrio aespoeensis Aspo-2]MBU4245390.1 hypothetical protein [Pseudomonadota bacterium]MBU4377564.1 hypothetical protein [Pseudomonadota bacterium]MBU4474640.1 hypothetical protein [Pseudomonadota bacterium]